jgi:hypothetical protein
MQKGAGALDLPHNAKDDQKLPPSKADNPIVSILFNIALPAIILSKLSEPERLGPNLSLIAALALPLGYFLWDFAKTKKANFISVLGFVSILLTGGLGLMQLDGIWFAVKEAAIPAIIAIFLVGSLWTKYPLVRTVLYNDKIIDVEAVNARLIVSNNIPAFNKLLVVTTWFLASSFVLSSILNFVLAVMILKSPTGTPEFNKELAEMTALSYPVIAIPSMAVTMLALWKMLSGLKKLTGLEIEAIFKVPPPKNK